MHRIAVQLLCYKLSFSGMEGNDCSERRYFRRVFAKTYDTEKEKATESKQYSTTTTAGGSSLFPTQIILAGPGI